VSRVGLGFSSNQNLGFLRKSKVRASFHYFFGFDFDGCSSVCRCPCAEYFV
jgi:hypothetical protein